MAEAICNEYLARLLQLPAGAPATGPIRALSAGLSARQGSPMPVTAQDALRTLGVAPHEHAARDLSSALVDAAERIYCMTESQRETLISRFPSATAKTDRLDPGGDVPDPGGLEAAAYVAIARRIQLLVLERMGKIRSLPG
jgi:protein-tyrosine-phosphatase